MIKKFIKTIDENYFFNLLKFVHFIFLDFKNIIYNFIKKFFSFLEKDIRFKKNLNFDEIYKKYKKKSIIFDVGANIGSSIKRFDLIFNNCVIHSFEPIKECFDQMVRDYPNKRFIKNNYALGENNTNKRFFINKHSVTSSFYKINKSYDETDKNDKPKNSIKTKIMTLDTYINLNKIKKIDILKIDTQGYELSVLNGAKNSLKKNIFHFVELEVILCDYYKKNTNLHEIINIMCKNNFDLFNLQKISYNKDSQIKWFDMLFINKKFK